MAVSEGFERCFKECRMSRYERNSRNTGREEVKGES